MIFASLFLLLALAWSAFVTVTVIESAQTGAATIEAFARVILTPVTIEQGIWFLCALSASAALALVTAVYMIRGRRLERRMAAELDSRIATRSERDAGDTAVSRLLEHRVAELQTSVDTLTAQRDAIYEEIRSLRAKREDVPVIQVPDADDAPERGDIASAAPSETG